MPELINEGSVKKPLHVGAADPYEFFDEHAADAAYWSDVARAKRRGSPSLSVAKSRFAAFQLRADAAYSLRIPDEVKSPRMVGPRRAKPSERQSPGVWQGAPRQLS
jgi:hypothetical protein